MPPYFPQYEITYMQCFDMLIAKLFLACCAVICTVANSYAQVTSKTIFQDPLNTPSARISGALKLEKQPILTVTVIKGRIIGVGLRGLIVLSDDGGNTWRQAQVPVQSDLTAVTFPTRTRGWAVGHEGVILTTHDAGETWTKQFDGKMAATLLPEYYQKRINAGDASMQRYLDHVKLNDKRASATLPYLSVYFENDQTGYAVGSFGSIIATQDGGKTWEPWLHHIDNDQFLNLYDIQKIGSTLYMTSERGIIWKLDKAKQSFISLSTGYRGSFFSIAGHGDTLLAVGLGGTAFRSTNSGATWQNINLGTRASLTKVTAIYGGLKPLIISQTGELFTGDTEWNTFQSLPTKQPMVFASSVAAEASGRLILAGYDGIKVQALPPMPAAGKYK